MTILVLRAVVVVLALGAPLLAGCSGSSPSRLSYDTPAAGRDAAFEAALRHDATARLMSVWGAEPTKGSEGDAEGDRGGFEAPVWEGSDPVIDGRADAWLWTFNGTAGAWDVLTSGAKVIGERKTPPEAVADLAGVDAIMDEPGSSSTVDYDTAAMVPRIAAHDPDWVEGIAKGHGAVWVLREYRGGARWTMAGFDPINGGELWYEFDGHTGELVDSLGFLEDGRIADPQLALTDCTNHGGVFPVDADAARAALPAGFEPVLSPNDPADGATLYILFLRCAGSSVDGNDTGATAVAYAELAVVPPDAYTLPRVTDYTVPLAIGASADAVGDRLAEWMLGSAGRATATDITTTGGGPERLRMQIADVTFDLTAQMAPEQGATLADAPFALVGVQSGIVRTLVQGHSQGGTAVQGTVIHQSTGHPLVEGARPIALGFSVQGFSLSFALVESF